MDLHWWDTFTESQPNLAECTAQMRFGEIQFRDPIIKILTLTGFCLNLIMDAGLQWWTKPTPCNNKSVVYSPPWWNSCIIMAWRRLWMWKAHYYQSIVDGKMICNIKWFCYCNITVFFYMFIEVLCKIHSIQNRIRKRNAFWAF